MARFNSGGGGSDSGTDTTDSDAAEELTERDEGSGDGGIDQERINEAFGIGGGGGGAERPPSSGGPPAPARPPSDRDAASPLGGGLDQGGPGDGGNTTAPDAPDRGQPGGGITSGGGEQTQDAPDAPPERPRGEGIGAGDTTQKGEVGEGGPGGGVADPVGTYTSPREPQTDAEEGLTDPEPFDESDQQDLGDNVVGNDIERQLNQQTRQLTQFGETGGEVVGTTIFRPFGTVEAVVNGQSYEEFATTDESQGEQATEAFLGTGVGSTLAIPPATASAGIEVLETGAYLAGETEDARGTTFGERAREVGDQGAFLFASTARETAQNPAAAAGATVFGFGTSAAVGRAAGIGIRAGRDRVRSVGADTFDLRGGEIVNPGTGRLYDPRAPDPENPDAARFPGADDPDTYTSEPPAAVRSQAEDYTPESVEQRFEDAGVTEGTTLKKAVDVEPDAPQTRRLPSRTVAVPEEVSVAGRDISIPDRLSGERTVGGQRVSRSRGGFESQPGDYESPGAFAGPELSPYFLGLEERTAGFSLRPGLPDTGDQATGVLLRTRVDRPDAENMDQFRREMVDREGETTARTKPESEANPAEIEAVIPPEAEFARLPGGPLRGALRSAGIGSDFAVRIGGRRVPGTNQYVGGRRIPLRPAADPDLIDSPSQTRRVADFLRDERAQAGGGATSGPRTLSLDELYAPMERPVDRPAPVAVGGPTPTSDGNETATRPSDGREIPAAPPTIPTRPDGDGGQRDGETSRADRSDGTRRTDTDTTRRDTTRGRGGDSSGRPGRGDGRDSTGRGGSGGGGGGGGGSPGGGRGGEDRSIPGIPPSIIPPGDGETPPPPPTIITTGGGGSGGGGGGGGRGPTATLFPDVDRDESGRDDLLLGTRDPVFVDFIDPLSGDVIETEREGVDR